MPYRFEALSRGHDRASFRCGTPVLDLYLQTLARKDAERRLAAPFVMVEAATPTGIVGYYTLSAFTVELTDLPALMQTKLPRYSTLPATLIGRLARDTKYKGQGTGPLLLIDAVRRALAQTAQIASLAVVADAKDASALRFYLDHGFALLGNSANRVFIPMATIAQLYS